MAIFGSLFNTSTQLQSLDEEKKTDDQSQKDGGDTLEKKSDLEEAKPLDDKIAKAGDESVKADPIKMQDMSALSHLDERATTIIAQAMKEAKKVKQTFIEPEHILLALLTDKDIIK